jgi:hypothetical protein
MACGCKKKNQPVSSQEALDIYIKLKNGEQLTVGERDTLYFFHNQNFGTNFKTYCTHCWSGIIKNLDGLWENQQS